MSDGYGGIISSVIGLGSDIGNMFLQKGQNRRNRKAMAEENARNRQFAQDQSYTDWLRFQENREYNDPKNQMERLRNAGINPHLSYSNGAPMNTSNQSPGASAVPVGQAYQGKAPQMNTAGLMAGVNNALLLDAQIDNIKADTNQKNASANNTQIIAGMNAVDLENKVNQVTQENQIRDSQISQGNAQTNLTNEQVRKTTSEIINLAAQNEEIKGRIDLLASQKQYTEQQKINLIASLSQIWAIYRNLEANTGLLREKTNTERSIQSNIHAETLNKQEQYKAMSRGNAVGEKYDFSNAESASKFNDANAKKALNMVEGSRLDNSMKSLKLTEQEYINTIRMFETVGSGVDLFKKAIPGPSSSTTTRFNSEGDYQGHSTTRRHR